MPKNTNALTDSLQEKIKELEAKVKILEETIRNLNSEIPEHDRFSSWASRRKDI